MKAKKVLDLLNITRPTLTRYVNSGKIRIEKLDNGFYEYNEGDVKELERKETVHKNKIVIYLNGSKFEYCLPDEKIEVTKKIVEVL